MCIRDSCKVWPGIGWIKGFMLLQTRRTQHFEGLKTICHNLAHSNALSRSDWRLIKSLKLCNRPDSRVSSANNLIDIWPISLTNNQKHKGSNTIPWGTPNFTQDFSLCSPLKTTCWVLLISHASIQAKVGPQLS